MKIPQNIKIGGKVYAVEVTNDLHLGAGYSAEINYDDLTIRLRPNAQAKMESDFIHEMFHGIYDHLGYTDHDENKIDELGNALYAVIVDNPGMFIPGEEGDAK